MEVKFAYHTYIERTPLSYLSGVLLKLFYQPDGISLVGVILSVFVFTKVLEHEILALILGNLDEHLAVSYLAILQIALVGVIAYGLLVSLFFTSLKADTWRWL